MAQCYIKQKLQASDGGVERDGRCACVNQMQLIAPQILCGGSVRGAPQLLGESAYRPDIGFPCLGRELAHAHILQHALTQRRYRLT